MLMFIAFSSHKVMLHWTGFKSMRGCFCLATQKADGATKHSVLLSFFNVWFEIKEIEIDRNVNACINRYVQSQACNVLLTYINMGQI